MPLNIEKRTPNKYGQLPIYFIPNRGQLADHHIQYYAQGAGCEVFFTNEGASFVFKVNSSTSKDDEKESGFRLDFCFLGANQNVKPEVRIEMPGTVNYFRGKNSGKTLTNISVYQEVIYREVWPGVDLVFRGEQGKIKYEFVLQPGAKVEDIQFTYKGAEKLSLDEDGNLLIDTPFGVMMDTLPVSYHEKDGNYQNVESAFQLIQGKTEKFVVTFTTGKDYDSRYPLIIDPGLVYSTYLGGTDLDRGLGIAVDSAGNTYITGVTLSADFPTTPGAFDTSFNGIQDAFVTKLNPTGTALVYSTYLGGSDLDSGLAIAVDTTGNAYITGVTQSANFPTTSNTFASTFSGVADAFVTKLNPNGTSLIYSTYLGGTEFDQGVGIAVDTTGNAYVTGITESVNFPTTPGAFDTSYNGNQDAFVTKLNPTGTALVYSTYLGGLDFDLGYGIAVDTTGNAYVTGITGSVNFPTTPGAYDTSYNGNQDVFVTKLNSTGTALVYSTFLGGSNFDQGSSIAIDIDGNAYITGNTLSVNFPTTPGAFDSTLNGTINAFVTKLNPQGSALVYSTYLGGSNTDLGFSIAVGIAGNAYVTGRTNSIDFPTTADAFSRTSSGNSDAFVTKLNPNGTALAYSTYLGGSDFDQGTGIAVDIDGNIYVTGYTLSANFPTTPGAFDITFNGTEDAFCTKISTGSRIPFSLEVVLTKDIQVQSDATLSFQGDFCEPRKILQNNQDITDYHPQKENNVGCIRAKRVHDWVVFCSDKQQKGFIPGDFAQLIIDCQNAGGEVTVSCEAVPGSSSFTILNDTKLVHEKPETHIVVIQFTILIRLQYFCNRTPLFDFEVPVTTVDRVVLCYPKGTSIVAKVTAVECVQIGENC